MSVAVLITPMIAYAQDQPAPTATPYQASYKADPVQQPTEYPFLIRPLWVETITLLDDGACNEHNDDWIGVVQDGILSEEQEADASFPEADIYWGGICFDTVTHELRWWHLAGNRGNTRIFQLPNDKPTGTEYVTACNTQATSISIQRQGSRDVHVRSANGRYAFFMRDVAGEPAQDWLTADTPIIIASGFDQCTHSTSTTYLQIPIRTDFYFRPLSAQGGFLSLIHI